MLRIPIAAVVLMGSVGLAGSTARAGEPATAKLTPDNGAVGASVTITGTGCLGDGHPGTLNFGFIKTSEDGPETTLGGFGGNQANADGSWAFGVVIPSVMRTAGGEVADVLPGPHYAIKAVCIFDAQPELWVTYPELPFEVTGPAGVTPDPGSIATPDPDAKPSDEAARTDPGSPSASTGLSPTPIVATPIDDPPPYTG
jgi:hypothetical protein